jgi:hypothetical protein
MNTMVRPFRSRPQLEALEDRLPPGDLRGGLNFQGHGACGAQAAPEDQLAQDLLDLKAPWGVASWQAAAAGQDGRGGEVLPATAQPYGLSLTDMARITAPFIVSGDLSLYPQTPFQILYLDPTTQTISQVNGGLVVTFSNHFSVAAGTPFYVPLVFFDDSPPVLGTYPTDPGAAANYVFAHDQFGLTNSRIVVDGRVTAIGSAFAAGPVQTVRLPDSGGTHIITVAAFLTPLSPGTHTVVVTGEETGVLPQQASGFNFQQVQLTYTITVLPH